MSGKLGFVVVRVNGIFLCQGKWNFFMSRQKKRSMTKLYFCARINGTLLCHE